MKTKLTASVVVLSVLFHVGLFAAEQGDDNPTGVAGAFNGNITTGCSYDPYTGNARRQVDDIVVPGSVGAYPLKWTRYFNSHATFGDNKIGGQWRFSYLGYKDFAFPDGRELTDDFGVEDHMGTWNAKQAIFMADGGKVLYQQGQNHSYPVQIIDPYGQVTTLSWTLLSTYPYQRLDRVTEPGGRYLKINSDATNTYVTSVQAFDGIAGHATPIQSVTYTWATQTLTMQSDGSHANSFTVLTRADYSDGTFATYTYTEGSVPVPICTSPFGTDHWYFALLATASDVRYSGPMRQIKYQYYSTGNKTRISSEQNSVINQAVSTITGVSSNGTATATETRGDGRTRTLNYYSVQRCMDCPPPDTETCNPPGPLDGKLQSFTDFQNHATILTYETDDTKPSAGFITAVKDASQNTTTYTRSSLSWAILRITHPDGKHLDQTYTDEANPYYLASRTDENGHTTIYHRDDPANPNAITRKDYPEGSFETFAYNNFGQVLTHRMRNGAYQHFKYDTQSRGLLMAKTNPTWTSDYNTALATDPQTTYTYYGVSDYNGAWTDRIKTETDPRGLVTQYEYDHLFDSNGNETTTPAASRGLVTKRIHVSDNSTYQSVGYNKYGDKLWEENELRKRTAYTYDDYGRVRTITDPLIKTTTNDYTPSNNTSLSPYVHTTNSIYTTTTPTGIVTQNIYDENFRKISTTAGFGTGDAATTWFQYDAVGNPTKITDPRGSGAGDQTYTTTTDYDTRNRKWHVTDPQGHVITFGYDGASNILTIKRPDNSIETKTYNEVNRVLTDALPKAGPPASPTEFVTTTFEYYPGSQSQMAGELWHLIQQQTASVSLTTTFEYDPSGMKTKMTYPNNTDSQTWTYDTDHNLIARRTVNGVSQLFSYDSRNRQISMTWSNSLDWATFGYDVASRMTSAQNPISIVTRAYDDANRLTLDRQNLQILPITAVSRKIHGAAGTFDVTLPLSGIPGVECRSGQGANGDQHQLIVTFPRAVSFTGASVTTGTGTASASQNADHTQVTINLSGVANAQMIIVTLSGVTDGDVSNNVLIGMTVLLGDTTGNGSVNSSDISQVQFQSGQTVTSSNFREDVTVNGLINSSDIALVQGQSGTGVTSSPITQPTSSSPNIDVQYAYDYDGKNTRLFVTSAGAGTAGYDLTFKYNPDDGQGRFKSIYNTGGAELFEYAYDKASNETHRTNKTSGVDQVYGRDNLNRMTERDVKAGTTALSVEVYAYDPTRPGLLTTVTRQELGQQYSTQDLFGYDLLPELMSAQYNVPNGGTNSGGPAPNPPLRTAGYNWDRAGNRTSSTDSAGSSYSYQVTNLNQYWTDGISNMGNGSEHELASYQNVNYTYVNDTHLSLVSGMDIFGQQSRYELYYDALGRCVVRILNGSITYYIYDGEKSILEYRSWSGPSGADVYGKGIDEILRRTDYTVTPARTVYYQDDHEGNTTHLTDGSGNIVEWYRYDAFGKPAIYNSSGSQITTSGYGNRFMFTGREYVATFAIYEYRNRAYHPGLGRFMSEDPKIFGGKDLNLFRYVYNDPLELTDPDGTYFFVDDAILFGGGALVGMAGQGLEDALSGHYSGWQAYVGAGIGGGIGGVTSEYLGPAGPFIGSGSSNFITQELRMATGAQHGFNGQQFVMQTAIGGGIGNLPIRGIPMRGVDRGSNSYSAVAKQIHTKFQNNTINNVSAKTAVKATVGRAADDSGKTTAEATMNAAARSVEPNANQSGNSMQNVTGHMEFSVGRDPTTGRPNTPLLSYGVPRETPPPIRTTSEEFIQPK